MINIKLILEGNEELAFFQILEEGSFIRSDLYRLSLQVAGGASKIPSLFNQAFQSGRYDVVLAVYDVDSFRTNEFANVQNKMKITLGSQEEVNRVSIWSNPTGLLLLLAPCSSEKLGPFGKSKKGCSPLVHKFYPNIATKAKPYDAQEFQLEKIKEAFRFGQYNLDTLLQRMALYAQDIQNPPSTNILPLLEGLCSETTAWVKQFQFHRGQKKK